MEQAISAKPLKPLGDARPRLPRHRWFPIMTVFLAPAIALLYGGFFGDVLPGFWMVFDPWMFALLVLAGWIIALLGWFAVLSGYSAAMRLRTLASIVVLCCVGCLIASQFVEFVGFSGGMIPMFRTRNSETTAELPTVPEPKVDVRADRVDLTTTTPNDFPQFLGPRRDNRITNVRLNPDWDASPPKLLWKEPIGAGWAGFAIVGDHAVTIQQRAEEEWTTCHELLTGKIVWKNAISGKHFNVLGGLGPRSTPTIDGGRVYVMHAIGTLRCLDGGDGKTLWEHDLLAEFGLTQAQETNQMSWGRAASPLVHGNAVLVPAGGPSADKCVTLVAYDKVTGAKLWQGGHRAPSYASPSIAILDGVEQILMVSENYVGGYDPSNGSLLWEADWPGSTSGNANCSNARQVGPDRVFLSKAYGVGSKLMTVTKKDDAWTTQKIWASPRNIRTKFSNVVFKDGFVYGLSEAYLECAEIATGKRKWTGSRFGYGQILGVGDYVLVQCEDGDVALVEMSPEKEIVRGRFEAIEGTTWNQPALTGRYLVVRNGRQAACYELPLAGP
jgi:outer membrane protein assembly factor BamB